MSTPRTYLWADSLNNRLVYGWRGLVGASTPRFRRGDEIPITVRWVMPPRAAGGEMSELVLPLGNSYAVYVGRRAERPLGGQFYVSYGGVDSRFIDLNANASVLERELNRIATVSATGGVSVMQLNGDIAKITFLQKGARTALTVNGKSLFPASEGVFTVIQEGDVNNYHVVAFKLRQLPLGSCTTFEAEPACEAEVEQLKPDIWDVYLTSDAKDGGFDMSIDDEEPITVSVFEDYETFQSKLPTGFNVTRVGDYRWRIQKNDGTAFTAEIVSSSNIVSFNGVQGTLVITGSDSDEFLSGKAFAGAFIEINRENIDGSELVVQTPCVVLNRIYI